MVSVSGTADGAATRRKFWGWVWGAKGPSHWYLHGVPQLFTAALRGAKAELDPAGIMNPGVLLRPAGAVSYSHEGGR